MVHFRPFPCPLPFLFQIPRYNSLKRLLSSVFQHFLTCEIAAENSPSPPDSPSPQKDVPGPEEASPSPKVTGPSPKEASPSPKEEALSQRMEVLQRHLDEFPRNKEDKDRLLSCGYSSLLWEKASGDKKATV